MRDIRPYICTFKDCPLGSRLFDARHEWLSHELEYHRREWFCDPCHLVYRSGDTFENHLRKAHPGQHTELKIGTTVDMCGRALETDQPCNICGHVIAAASLARHLGRHMEEMALYVVHQWWDHDENDKESDGDEPPDDDSDLSFASSPEERNTEEDSEGLETSTNPNHHFIVTTDSDSSSDARQEVSEQVRDGYIEGELAEERKAEEARRKSRNPDPMSEEAERIQNQNYAQIDAKEAAEQLAYEAMLAQKKGAVIIFRDAHGGRFHWPFRRCRKWEGMKSMILENFFEVWPLVESGSYDLYGPDGRIIHPKAWEFLVEPNWEITMQLHDSPEQKKDLSGYHYPEAPCLYDKKPPPEYMEVPLGYPKAASSSGGREI